MKIRTKYALMTAALIGSVVAAITVTVTKVQRQTLEADSRERLETLMEGVERLALESVEGRDELMVVRYLMFLQKERPELVHAAITRRGHTSNVGAARGGLVYLSRTIAKKRPVTYTVTAYPTEANPAENISVSTSGVSLNVAGNSLVRIDEGQKPETFNVKIGFLKAKLDADLNRALEPLFRRTLAVAGFFMALGLVGSVSIAKLITTPLMALTAAVGQIENGRLDVSVSVDRKDEVGALARRFNGMTAHIKELLEFREDILHTLTHELNTPLGGLKGYLELWQDRKLPAEPAAREQVVETMMAAVMRMENSLGNALRLFKSDSGKSMSGAKSVVWVDEVFTEMRTLYAPVAHSKNITIHDLPHDAVAFLCADPEVVRQIVNNLISNALKYTPDGGEIRLGLRDAEGRVDFWVSDTGYGIAEADIPHLFTKFYRSHDKGQGAQRIPGTGLGLNIVAKAVAELSGQIKVESQLGQGSTFYVSIPRSFGSLPRVGEKI